MDLCRVYDNLNIQLKLIDTNAIFIIGIRA